MNPSLLLDVKANGGFSFSPTTGEVPADGYMVALTGNTVRLPVEVLDDLNVAAKTILPYVLDRRDVFDRPDVYLGGWIEDGFLWLEPSIRVTDLDAALALGAETDQIAVYDVRNGTTINTGGAGGFLT